MKRMYYVSQFSLPLTRDDIREIGDSAARFNHEHGITGALVCLGTTFFQVIEGDSTAIDRLYNERILCDRRHQNIYCLKSEVDIENRLFPHWDMQVFNLNEDSEVMPMAFRQMLLALLETSQIIAQYTQPSVLRILEKGINPTEIRPARKQAGVLFSDIIGFSLFAERLEPTELITLVDQHVSICADQVDRYGGEVNKLLGDGVMAYFDENSIDSAVSASLGILQELNRLRDHSSPANPSHLLHGGVGLTCGPVYEGNIGPPLKRDYTVLGNTVNLASRLESLTRELGTPFIVSEPVTSQAGDTWQFRSLGEHHLKGQSKAIKVFGLEQSGNLDVTLVYDRINTFLQNRQA